MPEAPQPRPEALDGKTYKVKLGENSLYVTVTDITDERGTRPFEVFIISQNPEHQEWTTALTRMISAIFRRPHDSRFVVDELKAVFSAKGGGFWKGRYWQSTVAAIGRVIEVHMEGIGYLEPDQLEKTRQAVVDFTQAKKGQACPKCLSPNLKNESGCLTCLDCGHSKCG